MGVGSRARAVGVTHAGGGGRGSGASHGEVQCCVVLE